MFTAALFVKAEKGQKPNYQRMNRQTKYVISIQWNTVWPQKGVKY